MVNRRLLVICLVLCGVSPMVQSQPIPKAGLVVSQCQLQDHPDPAVSARAAGLCTFLLRGFVDGLSIGANRGLRVAFIEDKKNLETTAGVDDLMRRIDAVRPSALCLPPTATIRQLASVFADFMRTHPELSDEPYPGPAMAAWEAHYCPK